MKKAFGFINFDNEDDLQILKETIAYSQNIIAEPDRVEYGDFQTNIELANKVAQYLETRINSPEIIIEPTCGKGNFIIASLQKFKKLTRYLVLRYTNHMYGKPNSK